MFRSLQQIVTLKSDYTEKTSTLNPKYKCMLSHAVPLRVVDCGLILSYLGRTFRIRPLPSPPLGGRNVPRRGLIYCSKKALNFRYQSIMYVTPSSTPLLPLWQWHSIAQLYMTALAKFHSFSVAFIMDRHLLRSALSTISKFTTQQAKHKNNKPVKLTAKWGGSFMNFWKCKQAESFVRQIIITGCQIMKGGRWVQMSVCICECVCEWVNVV